MSRLREHEREALSEEHERVEEAARECHVVVNHEQPVVSMSGMGAEQVLKVFELPALSGVRRQELDLVTRAQQLRVRCGQQVPPVDALDAEQQPAGRTAARNSSLVRPSTPGTTPPATAAT